jgi:hypothetical protein
LTFKDLKKLVEQEQRSTIYFDQETTNPKLYTLLQRLKHKEFWIWDKDKHRHEYKRTNGDCCLNHILGLPEKEGKHLPMFPYEQLVFNAPFEEDGSFTDRHVWVKKATGLGITELALRIVVWLCTKDDSLRGKQFVLVTGPNITLAVTLIKRMKALFLKHNVTFDNKETVLELNGCHIECYPSHHVDAFRSLESPKFILLDECDFFPPGQQQAVRDCAEIHSKI